jgi:ABC-2 type transport system ATP-binding protein
MNSIISVSGLGKAYASGHVALHSVDLDIREGEIFALLGPNGAGKTTLINMTCGIVNSLDRHASSADGTTSSATTKTARKKIGLVPQELHTDAFETRDFDTVTFSRGLFGFERKRCLHRKSCCAISRCGKSATPRSWNSPAA